MYTALSHPGRTHAEPLMNHGLPARPNGWKTAVGIQLFASVAAAAYWGVWYFGDHAALASQSSVTYLAFQNAFPLADAWLVFTCLAGCRALINRSLSALVWVLLAGSSSIYLGLIDITFNLENRVYLEAPASSLAVEVALNLLSLGLGGWGIWFGWQNLKGLARG
jgi:hypothetical protein